MTGSPEGTQAIRPQSPVYAAFVPVLGCHLPLTEGLIDLSGYPEVMEQNSQSPGDGHHRPLPRVLSGCCSLQTPAAEVTIGTSKAKDVLRSVNEHVPEEAVASLRDPQLGRRIT